MPYTIKQAAERTHIPATTLRYYDRQGLLPFLSRRESGYRDFSEGDLQMLRVIECLKRTGMSIEDIRRFTQWVQEGDASLQPRYEMFLERRRAVEAQMAALQEMLDFIDHKCRYYEEALAAGTEAIHFQSVPPERLPCEE